MSPAEREASLGAARRVGGLSRNRGLRLAVVADAGSGGLPGGFGVSVLAGPRRTVVRPVGELDVSTAAQLETSLYDALEPGTPELVVDLRWLRFCDAAGLQVFLRARRAAFSAGAMLWLEQPTRIVRRVLEVSDLAWMIDDTGSRRSTS